MSKFRKLLSSGFTLVEVLITLTVVSLLLGVIANFAITTFAQSNIESARAELLGQSQITLDRIINDVRLSAGATELNRWPDANNPNGELAWTSDGLSLVLATAVVDSSNNIVFADPASYISEKNDTIYFVEDGTLYKRVLASTVPNNAAKTTCPAAIATVDCPADRKLLDNVVSFTIKYLDGESQEVSPANARSVEVNIKTAITKFSHNITSDYTTRAVFRND